MENSIVNILYTSKKSRFITGSCSGFCIDVDGVKFIVTCYHCMGDVFIIKCALNNEVYSGEIIILSQFYDIIILTSDICNILTPLKISDSIPILGEKFTSWSFQSNDRGGINSSTGRLKSIDSITHSYFAKLIVYKIDMVGIPGDSGCVIVNKANAVIGVLSQTASDEETVDIPIYIIPNISLLNIIRRISMKGDIDTIFLPELSITTQHLTSALGSYLNYKNNNGVVIQNIHGAYYKDKLKVNDILVKINNINITSDGKISLQDIYPNAHKLFYIDYDAFITNLCSLNTKLDLTVYRNNKLINVNLLLQNYSRNTYVFNMESPESLLWCGLKFKSFILEEDFTNPNEYLRSNYLVLKSGYNNCIDNDIKLVYIDFVIYSHILQIDVRFSLHFIKSVNNVIIKNINHLIEVIKKLPASTKFITITFYTTFDIIVIEQKNINILDKTIYFG